MKRFNFAKRMMIQKIDEEGFAGKPMLVVKPTLWEAYGIPVSMFLIGLLLGVIWGLQF